MKSDLSAQEQAEVENSAEIISLTVPGVSTDRSLVRITL